MSKIVTLLFLCFLMCSAAFAQPLKKELEKAGQIKLLESTREDVRKILADFEHDEEENEDYTQYFSTEKAELEITFSRGSCSEDKSFWNVPEWTATKIILIPQDTVKVKKFDFSGYEKEIPDEEFPESYLFHNKTKGIVFEIDDGKINRAIVYPPEIKSAFLCENENNAEYFAKQRRLVDLILIDSRKEISCFAANVFTLSLDTEEIIVACGDQNKNQTCAAENSKIFVTTDANDPEGDTLVYNYSISAGKIVGTGAKVVWDLSGVKAGTYTITAGVDDGCGVCGTTKTKTVTIKECSDCQPK